MERKADECNKISRVVGRAGRDRSASDRRSARARRRYDHEQAQEMLNELKQIRQALEKMQSPQAAPAPDDKVSYKFSPGGFSMGDAKAPLVIVEYTAYSVRSASSSTTPRSRRSRPITSIPARSLCEPRLSARLPRQRPPRRDSRPLRRRAGQVLEMRHVMIVNAEALKADNLATYAANVKLDVPKFKGCLESDKFKAQIDQDIAEGGVAGVQGTPSFVIGYLENDKLQGVRLVGLSRTPSSTPRSRRCWSSREEISRTMRCLLLAFALGVLASQQQAELPSTARLSGSRCRWHRAAAPHRGQRHATGPAPPRHGLRRASSTAVAIGLGGFFHAAWRAEARLADELPRAWKDATSRSSASSTSCPSRGARHALRAGGRAGADPGATVPSRVSLGWYGSWRDERAGQDVRSCAAASAGISPCASSARTAPSIRTASTSRLAARKRVPGDRLRA